MSLINRAKMIGGGDLFYLKFWIKVTALERNRWFSISSLRATQLVKKLPSLQLVKPMA